MVSPLLCAAASLRYTRVCVLKGASVFHRVPASSIVACRVSVGSSCRLQVAHFARRWRLLFDWSLRLKASIREAVLPQAEAPAAHNCILPRLRRRSPSAHHIPRAPALSRYPRTLSSLPVSVPYLRWKWAAVRFTGKLPGHTLATARINVLSKQQPFAFPFVFPFAFASNLVKIF